MTRNFLCAILLGLAGQIYAQGNYPFCQILDRTDIPPWELHAGYVTREEVSEPGGDDLGIFEMKGRGGLAYYRTGYGDFDITSQFDIFAFMGDGGIDLPDQVASLNLNGSYIRRNEQGQAMKLDVAPGIYSDIEDLSADDFFVPMTLSGIQALNPQISGLLGIAVYPGFEREFDPRFGIRWVPSDSVAIDLMYPESKVTISPALGWDVYAGVKIHSFAQYQLEEDDEREALTYEETRFYVGLNQPYTDTVRIQYQIGIVSERSLDFVHQSDEMDVDDGYFLSIGLSGML